MRIGIVGIVAVFSLSGCGGNGVRDPLGGPATPASVTLTLSSSDVMTSAGDTRTVAAVVRNDQGLELLEPAIIWSTSAPSVATVSGAGSAVTVTAVDDGAAVVTASVGAVSSAIPVSVHRRLATIRLTLADTILVFGSITQLRPIALDARQQPIPGVTGFRFATSDRRMTAVSPDGTVMALFRIPVYPQVILSAELTRDSVVAQASVSVRVRSPQSFDLASIMLPENILPDPVLRGGAGIAFFQRRAHGLEYQITWSELAGSATDVVIRAPAIGERPGDVLVRFGPLAQPFNYGVISGTLTAANVLPRGELPPMSLDSLVALVCRGAASLDVATTAHSGGELRGDFFCR